MAFRAWYGRRFGLLPAANLFGSPSSAVLTLNPFPPLGTVFLCRARNFGAAALPVALDANAAKSRVAEVMAAGRRTKCACNVLFAHLAVVTPLSLHVFGFEASWIALLVALLLLDGVVLQVFRRAHARLYPEGGSERRKAILRMAFSPLEAIRAHDALTRCSLESFHPLAAARALCSEAAFLEYGGSLLRHLRNPIPGREEPARPQEGESDLRALEDALETWGVALEGLLVPREREGDGRRSFCPRCLAQYGESAETCGDCGGLPLRLFDPS